jgi:hypothetical protein
MHKGIFEIKVHQFRPLGGAIPIYATFKKEPGTDKVFTIDEGNIKVTLPKGDTERLDLVFRLQHPDHILVGIAFANGRKRRGTEEFPVVTLAPPPDANARQGLARLMTIEDAHRLYGNKYHYDFVILVQDLKTGELGVIDPGVETSSEE